MQKKVFALLLSLLFFVGYAMAKTIDLPQPKTKGKVSVEEAIKLRRSERSFYSTPLTKEQIAQLLWACQGITDPQWEFRSVPSAGAIYPLEIYVADRNGVYHYLPVKNKLEIIISEDKRSSISRAALTQTFIEDAPLCIIITGSFKKTRDKYGIRAERYVFLEAGHAAENIHLQAVALGLGSVSVGTFWDDVISSALDLPPQNEPLYIIPIGYIKNEK
ncbi:hypothetical protein A2282_01005 [candidate division WOR-1 bacterium RIFOXYA12_FULL_36_13]|nr:MAG: hypothetical protein A2282_01005 [candidate division WOR-1 bacterium RIFOXYA12_FULL_36_13]